MKALVIGGNGFIGSHLVDELVCQEWEVQVLDLYERRFDLLPPQVNFIQGDLNHSSLVREALRGVEVVFHLAWASIHETSIQDPAADASANLIPTINLLNECRQADVKRVVFTSSGGTVYGKANQLPIPETHPTNPLNSYGIIKLCVEKYLSMYHHLYGLEYAVLRPSVPFGPRQNPNAKQGAVAVFLYRIAKQIPISIWGDGTSTRDFFYVSDLVTAFMACATKELGPCPVYNIGGPEETSLLQLIAMAESVTGRKAIVDFCPTRSFDMPNLWLNTRRAQQELDWTAQVSFTEGLEKTWQWMSSIL